ncbi:MAG TPA: HlyD family efflux transporter periplasmic adaptor subunit, partial [Oculatellaceae cyanobacterium]
MTIALKPQEGTIKRSKPTTSLPLPSLLNRIILFGAGAGLLTWGLALTANRVTLVTATKAFVNGKIVTITSPISGQVQTKASLDSGMPVNPEELLLKVNEPLSKSEWLQSIKFDLLAEQAKLESIEAKIRELAQVGKVTQSQRNQSLINQNPLERETAQAQEVVQVVLARLDSETAQTQADTAVRLAEQTIAQAQIDLKTAQSHAQLARSKYEKLRNLGNKGAVSAFSVKEAYNNWQVSQNQVEAARVKLETAKIQQRQQERLNVQQAERQKLESRSLQSNSNQLSINTNTEELNPELAELERQKSQTQVSIEAKKKALTKLEKDVMAPNNFPVLAASKGVLWEVMVQNGEQVKSGQPLLKQLNCQQLWVDAFVNVDAVKRITIGSPAQVELQSNNLKLNGWVKTIRSPLSGEQKLGQDVA